MPELLQQILRARGMRTAQQQREFLHPQDVPETVLAKWTPLTMAARRLAQAVEDQERVLIHGDFDVDGLSASALYANALQRLGLSCRIFIPERLGAGHGFGIEGLEAAREFGAALILTADTGTSAQDAVLAARQAGMDVIVTDHHEPEDGRIADALAVVNPKLEGAPRELREIAGVGVAYMVARAVLGVEACEDLLQLVALGTIADVMPLVGVNRLFVQQGLRLLNDSPRPGLGALIAVSRARIPLMAQDVAFQLAPRLNAPGRLGSCRPALDLLLASAPEAPMLARQLDSDNEKRRQIEDQLWQEALAQVEGQRGRAVMVIGQNWPVGILGLIAGRLAEYFGRPAVVGSRQDDEVRASGRSFGGADMMGLVRSARPWLTQAGGHLAACGMRWPSSVHPQVLDAFDTWAQSISVRAKPSPTWDAPMHPADLGEATLQILDQLEPCGAGNPPAILRVEHLTVTQARHLGNGALHREVRVNDRLGERRLVQFRAPAEPLPAPGSRIEVALQMRRETFAGRSTIALLLQNLSVTWHPPGCAQDWRDTPVLRLPWTRWLEDGPVVVQLAPHIGAEVIPDAVRDQIWLTSADLPMPPAWWVVLGRPWTLDALSPSLGVPEDPSRIIYAFSRSAEKAAAAALDWHFPDREALLSQYAALSRSANTNLDAKVSKGALEVFGELGLWDRQQRCLLPKGTTRRDLSASAAFRHNMLARQAWSDAADWFWKPSPLLPWEPNKNTIDACDASI